MTKLCYTTTYLDDVDGVDEGHGDDGGSSGHADLLEKSRGGGGAGGHRPSVGREGGVGEAHLDVMFEGRKKEQCGTATRRSCNAIKTKDCEK